ncbi:hypothetical protein GCM10017708_25110 [Arthrobacter citreus]|nr:hypothetical protein [Arthrobacter gandavensis]
MNRLGFLGLSTGTTILVAALFSMGAVFVGANGLIPLSIFAAAASLVAGTIGVAALATSENPNNLPAAAGLLALTLSLLVPLFTWTASATIPLAAVSVMALVPAVFWAATWMVSPRRSGRSAV